LRILRRRGRQAEAAGSIHNDLRLAAKIICNFVIRQLVYMCCDLRSGANLSSFAFPIIFVICTYVHIPERHPAPPPIRTAPAQDTATSVTQPPTHRRPPPPQTSTQGQGLSDCRAAAHTHSPHTRHSLRYEALKALLVLVRTDCTKSVVRQNQTHTATHNICGLYVIRRRCLVVPLSLCLKRESELQAVYCVLTAAGRQTTELSQTPTVYIQHTRRRY